MFVVYHFSVDSLPGEILYIYSAKTNLDILRERYQEFRTTESVEGSKSFIDQLLKEEIIILNKVLRSPFRDLDPEDIEFYGRVQKSQPLIVV